MLDLSLSPYLTQLASRYPDVRAGADVRAECFSLPEKFASRTELMASLRHAKNKLALLVAMGDISGEWTLAQVMRTLSEFADYALSRTLDFLLHEAVARGDIAPAMQAQSGIIILGMGKLGGFELNYSSDIDLIIFFEKDTLHFTGKTSEQKFMNKLAQDIVSVMQERTPEGYVFRTDLRLRPDPASTPPAIGVQAAYNYYESVGQNWERAAMIKARPVAGDVAAGERFLKGLTPYIWRRSLDFASINDIHSIKRQMDARGKRTIRMGGHNIKLGCGGIREIEFYTQIHQLIWGGRKPQLRLRATCDTLEALVAEGLVDAEIKEALTEAYGFHRMIEHRLQMIADEQTHTIPEGEAELAHFARFAGFENAAALEAALMPRLVRVHEIFSNSFKSADDLGDIGNLVFTGVTHDPDTLSTLTQMGYRQPEAVSEMVMGWHHGSKRCTRTKRARELLTELMPGLLSRLAATANPDAAFLKFDEFLTDLPAAIQLFSLFQANKELLGLIADIMGSAPALAESLARSPELIESVLFSDFYKELPDKALLTEQAHERTAYAADIEELIDQLAYFRNERQFQAGVQFLRGMVDGVHLGHFLTDLAEVVTAQLLTAILAEFEKTYGRIAGAEFSIIALGKAGSRELTFHSDLDLVFIYRVPDFELVSDGEKQYSASVYYNRLAQRLVNALSALGRAGKLYEVDTRLRPSGKQGLLAVSEKALTHYFSELAWTFEFMAFTKARPIAGDEALKQWLADFIRTQIAKPRDGQKLRSDVSSMRAKMAEAYATHNIWDLKHARGATVDVDFIAQYLLLRDAPANPALTGGSSAEIFMQMENPPIAPTDARFLNQLFHMIRLCAGGALDEASALPGLKKLLCNAVDMPDFSQLNETLGALEARIHQTYVEIIET